MSQYKQKAIVIGSGIAGIAASIRLAVKGYDVLVLEKNAYAGGKLSEIKLGNYRFDAGPSLFTMPEFVEELFDLAGKNTSDFFEYEKHDTCCHYFWNDGTFLKAHSNHEQIKKSIDEVFPDSGDLFLNKLKKAAFINGHVGDLFLKKSLHDFRNFLNIKTLIALLNSWKFDLHTSFHQANTKDLKNKKLVQLFDRFATYNGSNPYKTPGIMGIIPHFEHNVGTFFPKKGMVSITNSLVKLAESLGVKFEFNSLVEEILVENSTITGVKTAEKIEKASLVVSNMDVFFTYRKLLPNEKAPERILKQERSSSAIIFYWGIKKEFPSLDLHNIFFADDYKAEFEAIFEQKTIYNDPTIYIHISSKCVPDDAPKGSESWFVMVNAPSNSGQNWDEMMTQTRTNILKKLEVKFGFSIENFIEEEDFLDPRTIESKTASYQGSLYGTSSNSKFAAFLRHPNYQSKLKGLYFVGGSTHPGGGIPLCLLSAKIATDYVPNAS
uniref:1-hydroxycarotenoid 3,4-desaturase CrtD n=1 Tax=Flavobacterium sp. TaxID=239 RepID=UPI00404AD6BE